MNSVKFALFSTLFALCAFATSANAQVLSIPLNKKTEADFACSSVSKVYPDRTIFHPCNTLPKPKISLTVGLIEFVCEIDKPDTSKCLKTLQGLLNRESKVVQKKTKK